MKKILLLFFVSCFVVIGAMAQSGNALVLNGVDQYMRIADHSDFDISTSESFTATAWIKVGAWNSSQRFICKRNMAGAELSGYELWGAQSSSQVFANNAPNASGNHNNSLSAWTGISGSLNTWIHIAFVVDRNTGKMYLYQDGTAAQNSGTKDISPWYVDNSVAVLLGAGWNNSVPNWFFNGSMDNVRFYKIALSSSEIATDKNNEYANLTTSMKDGLVAAYDFETINGNIVPDISGNNHNGTLVGYNFEFDITADNNYTGRGNKDEVLLSAKLLSPSDLNFSSISIDMTGTTNISDVEKIKVYQTSTSAFDSRKVESYTKLGEIVPDPSGQTTFSVTGSATGGNATYLWLTYDIASDAKEGNVVAAKLSSISAGGSTLQTVDEVIATREILLARKLLYAPGDHGSKNYRIPAIVTAKDGSLVVGTDKRKNNQGDLPEDIDVLINRSTNNGVDWSEPITIAQGTGRGAGFGDVGLVRTAEENGLLAIYVGGDGFFEPQSSNSKKQRIYVSKSSDNGVSWGSKVEITDQLYGPTCSVASRQGWQAAFVSSGAGLLTRDGTICFVGVVRESNSTDVGSISNYVFYSEDNGTTWEVSSCCMTSGGNEAKIVELNDGRWLVSIRNQNKGPRYYTISDNRGQTWTPVAQWENMIEPGCNGDIVNYTTTLDGYDRNRMLHTIPYHSTNRINVSMFLSYDEGSTWSYKKTLCATGSAYSSICVLPDNTIGVYLEENGIDPANGEYSTYFLNFSFDWLTDGEDEIFYEPTKPQCARPVISPADGTIFPIDEGGMVSISCSTPNATIYYTTDGTVPDVNSSVYTAPFHVIGNVEVRALAIAEGFRYSDMVTASYTYPTYCHQDGTATDRRITRVNFSGALESHSLLVASADATPRPIFFDLRTEPSLKVTANNTTQITPIITCYNMYWTHLYVYIDYNNDGVFSTELNTNGTPTSNSELVSYTYYNGVNSHGSTSSNSGMSAGTNGLGLDVSMPSFTLPALPRGKYVARVKADWNSIDPCGDSEIIKNRGSFVDFTIESIYPVNVETSQICENVRVFGFEKKIRVETSLPTDVKIFDTNGRLICSKTISQSSDFSIDNGVYMVHLGHDNYQKVIVK